MGEINEYLFEPKIDRDGSRLPYSRMDIVWSVALGLALMVLLSFASELNLNPQQKRNAVIAGIVALGILVLNARRRLILGVGLALVAMRLAIGFFSANHALVIVGSFIFAVTGSYLLLRDVRSGSRL